MERDFAATRSPVTFKEVRAELDRIRHRIDVLLGNRPTWFDLTFEWEEPRWFRGKLEWRRRHERIRRLEHDTGILSGSYQHLPWESYGY